LGLWAELLHVSPRVQWVALLALVALPALYLLGLLGRLLLRPRAVTRMAHVDEVGITLGDERIPREAMRFAALVPETRVGPARLEIRGERQAPLVSVAANLEQATRILSVLRLDTVVFEGSWRTWSGVGIANRIVLFAGFVLAKGAGLGP